MRIFVLVLFFVAVAAYWLINAAPERQPLITGVSLVSPPRALEQGAIASVKQVNAAWVAIIPYAFSKSNEPSVTFDHERQWWGERTEGTIAMIQQAQELGLKVMLKPHVWVMGQGWTGDFDLATEQEWQHWEGDYARYILNFAQVADSMKVDLFCIGTEYRHPAAKRPEFWIKLIVEVRKTYQGKITYAANWDDYHQIAWWNHVDFIGIDAYFPLAEGKDPEATAIKEGWKKHIKDMAALSAQWKKQVIFTEYGFQSAHGAAGNHWEVDKAPENANPALQAKAYDATLAVLRSEPWFAGGFLWKWYLTPPRHERHATDWTPQGKPAEEVIGRWYKLLGPQGENETALKPK